MIVCPNIGPDMHLANRGVIKSVQKEAFVGKMQAIFACRSIVECLKLIFILAGPSTRAGQQFASPLPSRAWQQGDQHASHPVQQPLR